MEVIIFPFAPLCNASSISRSINTNPAFFIKLTLKEKELHFFKLSLILFKNSLLLLDKNKSLMFHLLNTFDSFTNSASGTSAGHKS